ncbi:MAG TPA: 4Fe-4S ferredoxin, partial [Desulfobacteraceae bacterium]|nr:4Fe-4S ferredoxin [Desulfobacteraceae bacterium]
MSDVYEQLRQRLDDLATGFPGTEQKVELRLLRRLFTQDEAEFFLQMSPMLETPAQVAGRLERPE